jgi:hypothetical protein
MNMLHEKGDRCILAGPFGWRNLHTFFYAPLAPLVVVERDLLSDCPL